MTALVLPFSLPAVLSGGVASDVVAPSEGTVWFDAVTFTVEAALSAATGTYGVWTSGRWDTATWGPDVVWADVSQWVRSLESTRRFSRDLQSWEPGAATVVLGNRDRRFSPLNLTGPYATSGITQIRPWRPIRWRATFNGITYTLFSGYALAWEETFVPGHADAYVTVPCVDEMGRLAAFDGVEMVPVGAGESSGRRIHRVLDNAGHTGTRAVDNGRVTVQATTLAANAVTELKLVADSEGGALWVDADGTIIFDQQYALMENTRSNEIQATFGDGSGTELPCANIDVAYNGDLVANLASFARVGGSAQNVADNASRALYGDRRASRTDLVCETDTQALGLATFWVERYKDPELRVVRIQIKPRKNPALLFPQVLGRRPRDLIRVVVRPIGGGVITRDCHIAGITHRVTADDWTTTFDLWSATVYQTFASSRFDVGKWDSAAWFF